MQSLEDSSLVGWELCPIQDQNCFYSFELSSQKTNRFVDNGRRILFRIKSRRTEVSSWPSFTIIPNTDCLLFQSGWLDLACLPLCISSSNAGLKELYFSALISSVVQCASQPSHNKRPGALAFLHVAPDCSCKIWLILEPLCFYEILGITLWAELT